MAILSALSLVASTVMRIIPQTETYYFSNVLGWILDIIFREILMMVVQVLFPGLTAT